MNPKPLLRPTGAEWALITLLAGLSATFITLAGPEVVVHYDLYGRPDKTGSPLTLLIIPAAGLAVFFLIKSARRFSDRFNYPVKLTPDNKNEQERLAFRLLDVYSLMTLILFNLILVYLIFSTFSKSAPLSWIWGPVFLISYLAPLVIYLRSATSKKDNP